MKNYHIFSFLLCLFTLQSFGQNYSSYKQQDIKFALVDIGVNGLMGGIGAIVNKNPEEKIGKTFWKRFGQGCLGGGFQYLGKKLTFQIYDKQVLEYAWASRLTNSIGSSITENAMFNKPFGDNWHLNVFFTRIDYWPKNERKFAIRLVPMQFVGMFAAKSQANKFDLETTLKLGGVLTFYSNGQLTSQGANVQAINWMSIAYDKTLQPDGVFGLYGTLAHEFVHTLQFDNSVYVNPLFGKLDSKWKTNNENYRKLSKYVYFDLPNLAGFFISSFNPDKPYLCRYNEREAFHFATQVRLPKCQ